MHKIAAVLSLFLLNISCKKLDVPSRDQLKANSIKGSLQFEYLNFAPTDPTARRGLELILQGRAFRPNGVPLQLVQTMYNARPYLNLGSFPLTAGPEQLSIFGKFPSFPGRTDGLGENGEDYTLGNSIVKIADCHDSVSKKEYMAFIPKDEFDNLDYCKTDKDKKIIASTVWHHNCFTCHAGAMGNRIIAGAHANYTDQYALSRELALLVSSLDSKSSENFLWPAGILPLPNVQKIAKDMGKTIVGMTDFDKRVLDKYLDYIVTELIPTLKWAKTAGDNIGPFTSFKGMGLLNPAKEGYSTFGRYEISPTDQEVFKNNTLPLVGVDANPWWNLKFKKTLFWAGDSEAINARQFIFAFTFQHEGMDVGMGNQSKRMAAVLQFAQKMHSPSYPGKIDWNLVTKGREIFHSKKIDKREGLTCSSCHGEYNQREANTSKWTVKFPGDMTGPIDVGTDPNYSRLANHVTSGIQQVLRDVETNMAKQLGPVKAKLYSPKITVASAEGVMPPPLVGLWASAPYFHNGSVPSVYYVLKAGKRPSIWTRPAFLPEALDQTKLGFVSEEQTEGTDRNLKADREKANKKEYHEPLSRDLRSIYFASDFGHDNKGHDFVTDWDDENIYAIIEFLKSVSGPDVLPARLDQGIDFSVGNVR